MGRVGIPGAVRGVPMSMCDGPCSGMGGAGSAGAVVDRPFIGLSRLAGWHCVDSRSRRSVSQLGDGPSSDSVLQ
jgi:hypothetical protein